MQIQNINFTNHKSINFSSRASLTRTVEKGSDTFIAQSKGLKSIKNIRAGFFGTCCDGAIPLKDFFREIKQISTVDLTKLLERGLSTNIDTYAHSYLKTKWDNPISTSGVMNCSVMYLANEKTKTHFLYHMHSDTTMEEITNVIKNFMAEGYNFAALIPGDKIYFEIHKKYLYEVFEAIKASNPNAIINVYQNSSKMPEIVGYRGMVYEIPRTDYDSLCQNTFKVQDIIYNKDLYLIDELSDIAELEKFFEKFKQKGYDEEINKAVQKMVEDKIISLGGKPKSQNTLFDSIKSNMVNIISSIKNPLT